LASIWYAGDGADGNLGLFAIMHMFSRGIRLLGVGGKLIRLLVGSKGAREAHCGNSHMKL